MEVKLDLHQEHSRSFELPKQLFAGLNTKGRIEYKVSLANGQPLPAGMVFDSKAGKFHVSEKLADKLPLQVRVQAIDAKGNRASVTLIIKSLGQTIVADNSYKADHSMAVNAYTEHQSLAKVGLTEQVQQTLSKNLQTQANQLLKQVSAIFG